ncbi:MAG: CDP-alcohol phosphatidyltransferase family protein [Chthoniobacterales bacterium]
MAKFLADQRAAPNTISVAGMLCGIAAGMMFAATTHIAHTWIAWLAGAVLVQLRLLANLCDGMVAVLRNIASPVGELFNEVPDRVSDAATLIGFGYAAGSDGVLGFIAALLAVFLAYLRAQGKVVGAPQEFCRPMAKQQRMATVTIAGIGLRGCFSSCEVERAGLDAVAHHRRMHRDGSAAPATNRRGVAPSLR